MITIITLRFKLQVKEKKLKSSRQRLLILNILRSTHSHPKADWIYEQARKEMSNISLGTVYRNLKVLRDEGRIRELSFSKGICRYDADVRDHCHVICRACGCIEDIHPVAPRAEMQKIEQQTGFVIHNRRMEYFGYCPDCQEHAHSPTEKEVAL